MVHCQGAAGDTRLGAMADPKAFRCATCGLDIVARDGLYRLGPLYYCPACHDRKTAAVPRRTLWAQPPLLMSTDVESSGQASG